MNVQRKSRAKPLHHRHGTGLQHPRDPSLPCEPFAQDATPKVRLELSRHEGRQEPPIDTKPLPEAEPIRLHQAVKLCRFGLAAPVCRGLSTSPISHERLSRPRAAKLLKFKIGKRHPSRARPERGIVK